MTEKRYLPRLALDERDQLEAMCRRGRTLVRQVTRARVLLRVDGGDTDAEMYPSGLGRMAVGRRQAHAAAAAWA